MGEILGVLFAVMVSAYMLTGLMAPQKAANDTVRAIATAQQQKLIYAAAAQCLENNCYQAQSNATATNPVIITVPMLQAAGLNVAGMTATNPYGQTWQVQVLQPSANNLQALVVGVGGDTLPDRTAALIARYVGQPGGIIPKNDTGIYPNGAGTAYGNYGGWNVPTAYYSGLAGGHPAALLTVVSGQVSNNFLYRNAVPGQPQLNQMHTALDMTGNDLNNAGNVNGKQGLFSHDGQTTCCNPNGQTLALSEATASTGRKPTIQFHAAGVSEGYIELNGANEPRRLNLKDNQGAGLGLNATGTISGPNLVLPNGQTLQAGGMTMGNNGNDTEMRQNGGLWIEHADGSLGPLQGVSNINASGDIRTSGNMFANGSVNSAGVNSSGNITTSGLVQTAQQWWSMIARDGGNNDNANPQDAAGSLYVNDIYIRSLGKWASQLGGGDQAMMAENGYTQLPSGLIIQWGHYNQSISYNQQATTIYLPKVFPHAAFNCTATPGYTGVSNDNGPMTISTCNGNALVVTNTSDASPVNGFYWMAIGW